MITRDECVDRMQSIWRAVDDLHRKGERSFTAADALKFEALAEQFDLTDAIRLCLEAGVPQHEIPLVVAQLTQ